MLGITTIKSKHCWQQRERQQHLQQQRGRHPSSDTLSKMTVPSTGSIILSLGWILMILSALQRLPAVYADGGDIAMNFEYVPSTNVTDYLSLAYDIRDMRSTSDFNEKNDIYTNGRNSALTLRTLSLDAGLYYKETPMFRIYEESFKYLGGNVERDNIGNFDGAAASQYADTLVQDLFSLNIAYIEATGSLVLNILQAYWGQLWIILSSCHNGNDVTNMMAALDIAVALYVGKDQQRKQNNKGYMLYNLAQQMTLFFNQDDGDGESTINKDTLETFITMQASIRRNICTTDAGYLTMRNMVRSLYFKSNTVLTQWLLYYVEETDNQDNKNGDFIELFTLALWPQIHVCNEELGMRMVNLMVTTDVTTSTKPAAIEAIQQSLSCLQISCVDIGIYDNGVLPQCNDTQLAITNTSYGIYQPTFDVSQVSQLDQDVFAIQLFMQHNVYDLAIDFYQYGWSSNYYSLQEIVKNDNSKVTWTNSSYAMTFYQYYQDTNDVNQTLNNVIINYLVTSDDSYTNDQRRSAVTGLLQGIVMYLGVMGNLQASVQSCIAATYDISLMDWESAIGLLVGSMNRRTDHLVQFEGQSLYDLSTEFCSYFNTCNDSSAPASSDMNTLQQLVLEPLSTGATIISSSTAVNCTQLQELFEQNIQPNLLIPLIQGYLSNIMIAVTFPDADTESHGFAYAFSYALMPFLHQVSSDYADLIKTNTPFVPGWDGIINVTKAFNAMRNLINDMPYINCADIGSYTYDGISYGLCTNDAPLPDITANITLFGPQPKNATTVPPVAEPKEVDKDTDPKDMAWGRYTFLNAQAAEAYANFTFDIRDIYYSSNLTEADVFYTDTSRRQIQLKNNVTVRSLEEFSTLAYKFMNEDPIYNFFRIALFDDTTFDPDQAGPDPWSFANAIELLAISPNNGNSPPLASDVIIVLAIWQMIAHLLYESSRNCMAGISNPELIDYAVALWIGQEQVEGRYDSGWSMYYIAQEAAKNFGLPEGEALVNTVLMENFNTAQNLTKLCASATSSSPTPIQLRMLVDDILQKLSLPLIQNLLFHMSQDNFQYVELFSLSVIPQTISCDEGAFGKLRDALFQNFNATYDNEVMDDLGIVLHCLRFQCNDFSSFNQDATQNDLLGLLTGTLCDELDYRSTTKQFSSYAVNTPSAIELSRLDLDVLQIEMLTRIEEYNLAYDIYSFGRNSRYSATEYNSLKKLATSSSLQDAQGLYDLQKEYFDGVDYYADTVIENLLKNETNSQYSGASRHQKAEIVYRTLQTSVTYLSAIAKLYEAYNLCVVGQDGSASIDEAAALYIGSIEGPVNGGSDYYSGRFMYGLSKWLCDFFNKCENHYDSISNQLFLFGIDDMRDQISKKKCDTALTLLNTSIIEQTEIPLIQALLYYGVENAGLDGASFNVSIASGAAIADSILPVVNNANATVSNTIKSSFQFSTSATPQLADMGTIFEAIGEILPSLGIDCQLIGTYDQYLLTTCPNANNSVAPPPDTVTNLGGDLYQSSTYVQDRADIALDVKDMEDFLTIGHQSAAELTYKEGKYSSVYDSSGKRIDLRSLASFSTEAAETMTNNPLFQMTVYALRDSKNLFEGKNATMYADTIVQDSFAAGKDNNQPLAAEAAVALNLWMEIANELFQTVKGCKDGQLTDADGIRSIDEAAAYWIGDGQIAGDAERGHLLYALAEEMGDYFGMSSGQSRTNQNILMLFHQVKLQLSQAEACKEVDTARRVSHNIDKIVSMMIVVQIQSLIHYLYINDMDRVRIYAYAFVPLLVGCNPTTFQYLKGQLLDGPFQATELDNVLASIRSTLPCFSLSCSDIGIHQGEGTDACIDPNAITPLTSYSPSSDVRAYSKLDLDILELDILMQMQAYEAAGDLYSFGKHASLSNGGDTSAISLQSLATVSGRSVVPQFTSFQEYYANDERYADTLILQALDSATNLDATQRRALVVGYARYMIMYMASLESMYDAIGACATAGSERAATAARNWDKAAAYMIGSLEGTTEAGTTDGVLFWQLSKVYCAEFGTCSHEVPDSSINNDKIYTLLYAGQGAILSGNCDALRKTAHDLGPKLLVPLIEGSLSATTKLTSRSTNDTEKELLQATAYVYAQSLLPLVQDADRQAAAVISKNFPLDGAAVPDGRKAIVMAYSSVLSGLSINCADIGVTSDVNVCTGDAQNEKSTGLIVGIVLMSLIIVSGLLLYRHRRKKKALRENKPEFMQPNGEFNHNSDLLIQSRETDERARSDAETDFLNGADADASIPEDDDAYVNAISIALDERDGIDNDEETSLKGRDVI